MNIKRNRPQGNAETSGGYFGLPQRLFVCVCVYSHVHTLLLMEHLCGRHVESLSCAGYYPEVLGLK